MSYNPFYINRCGDFALVRDDALIEDEVVAIVNTNWHLCDITNYGLFMIDDISEDDVIDIEYGCIKITGVDEV